MVHLVSRHPVSYILNKQLSFSLYVQCILCAHSNSYNSDWRLHKMLCCDGLDPDSESEGNLDQPCRKLLV